MRYPGSEKLEILRLSGRLERNPLKLEHIQRP